MGLLRKEILSHQQTFNLINIYRNDFMVLYIQTKIQVFFYFLYNEIVIKNFVIILVYLFTIKI